MWFVVLYLLTVSASGLSSGVACILIASWLQAALSQCIPFDISFLESYVAACCQIKGIWINDRPEQN